MSSHHIVREKQEPALLVLGLDNFDDEQLGQLLEWSPTLITTPPVAERLNAFGIKIDWIITGELNSDYLQSDIKHLAPGDDTLISAALNWLTGQGYPAVNIVTDELDLENYLPFANKINLVLFYNRQKIYAVNTGFNKWKPANESISLLSAATNLKTDGLEKTANNTFHTIADGFFTLKFDAPLLLFIAETL
ncbi:thiamine pyrophosphokinase [Mucilaginibacter sp. UR6-11]|uniref:thiamine pyrophosphokinase n=1 Tax=Mucilaginibacter sp. UR6-11 TaxID=1435644 RepID=UPI001E3F0680|nr:thiamine pyrophosphokinase [Mucilaginibacter sp. UR6-11]MCC8424452.1 thiamine pyrophosphokinase [Mucilaginibacter sp. UR6-11]